MRARLTRTARVNALLARWEHTFSIAGADSCVVMAAITVPITTCTRRTRRAD
ncbi:hypothetical protein KCP74_03775 [Salmonella enterica subsp. enterica]|nr:hypothetical protein KCP74_03775 [Salmonella enterica subsp. enterica]